MPIKQNKGFTLLEILLVIAAIGILAAIVLVAINPNRQIAQARNTVRQADINTIQKAVEQYLIEKGSYPSSITTTPGYICNTGTEQVGGSTNCSGRVDLRELVPDYIAGIPRDPQATGTSTGYNIVINPNNNKIAVSADLAESKLISLNPYIVTNGLVLNLDAGNPASYPGTGNTWFDLSGNGNNGTLVNGVGYNTANGGSLSFDGVDDRVDFSSFITGIENNHTIETAVYRTGDGINWPRFFINAQVNTSVVVTQFQNTTGILYRLRSGSTNYDYELPSGKLINNNWVLLSFSYDGVVMRAYINGIEYESGKPVNVIANTANTGIANIGGDSSVSAWNGRIGFNKLYNRALTPQEIQQNFNATRGRFGL